MSNRKLYALLCGINDYTPNVGSLHGCLNDVDAYEAWLSERFPVDQRSIEILKDSAATRRGIIDGFRQHLAQATANDIVLFQFAGHGARWKSAPQFLSYYPDGFDEGLVCWDSRRDPTAAGSYDLADKELAVLVAEVASRCPHVAVLLDCCHSGSGTRGADDFAQMAIRLTHQVDTPRPLESYLDGHYKRLHECNKGLANVASQHILLAACERKKQAFEGYDRRGIFSSTLLERLSQSGGAITYADLFLQVRATVQRKAFNQTPQFEVFRGFDGHQGFLGASVNRSSKQRYLVRRDSVAKQWTVDFGSIQGLLVEQDKPLEFRIYGSQALANAESSLIQRLDDPSEASVEPSRVEAAIGGATAVQVGLTKSVIELDFAPPKDQLFYAEVTSLPSVPMMIAVKGDETAIDILRAEFEAAAVNSVRLIDDSECFLGYVCEAVSRSDNGPVYLIQDRLSGRLVHGVRGNNDIAARHVVRSLAQIAEWESRRKLQNHNSLVAPSTVPLQFVEIKGGERIVHDGPKIRLVLDADQSVSGQLVTKNATGQQLYSLLVHFSEDYGMTLLDNDEFPESAQQRTLLLDGSPDLELYLDPDGPDSCIERFMLIVSSQPIDEFLLGSGGSTSSSHEILAPLPSGIIDPIRGRKIRTGQNKIGQIDWLTQTLEIELVRRGSRAGASGLQLVDAPVSILPHPEFEADVRLTAALSPERSTGSGDDAIRALSNSGLLPVNFAGARGEGLSVIELSNIRNSGSLAGQPLRIELNVPLESEESIVALTFDGEFLQLAGETSQSESGRTIISISEIPEQSTERARSIFTTVKLYLLKTCFKASNVNQLRSVDFREDGTVTLDQHDVADRLSKATKVVLLIHGMFGDGASMAKESHPALKSSMSNFLDLGAEGTAVLAWDYEHVIGTLQSTAKDLQDQLKSAGIGASDGKQLVIVGHSIGGLVARWLIEQGDGKQFVDELIMMGVPNSGAPFGKIGYVTTAAKLLISVAINFVPGVASIAGKILAVLLNVNKFTTTLEQLNADGDFLKQLNSSNDPHVQYTMLAGDVTRLTAGDGKIQNLIAKIGRSKVAELLFNNAAHDLMVSVGSSRNINHARTPAPRVIEVVCHHFSYLDADVPADSSYT